MSNKTCLITGGSGFIGSSLIPVLLDKGYKITVLSREAEKTKQQFDNKIETITRIGAISGREHFDVVINLAGQGIADKKWSDKIRKQLRASRIDTTKDLIAYFERATEKPSVFISGSATGFYGLKGDEKLTEKSIGDKSFSSRLCKDWEAAAKKAEALNIRACYLRTGIVLEKDGGALTKMLPPFKFGLGGPMGSGKQFMSWIHRDDLVSMICHIIETETLSGPINGTAPTPVDNKTFSKALGKALNRPAFLPLPGFVLKLLMGDMGKELLLCGQRVIPEKAVSSGFEFKYSDIDEALNAILSK
ncbi:TIGR01777 family oxidoreductase [Leucothrix arctica]|uniref:TIGR01777 family protein n=1 Tax=Leucothrix arctica TaxID=1481894 RepID=A0A317CI10_9GAMM|nr:TIGR01777 family oxidoreductase [Leucothrix arctica]PWQ95940.1 TIGR01777 family protein [Leucothrix arctica]